MKGFVKFPHTPHLLWLGNNSPRDDKVLSKADAQEFLAKSVIVEEKLDGANIGISKNDSGELQIQNRGNFLNQPFLGQFSRLNSWVGEHFYVLNELDNNIILFGEWCAAVHSVPYDKLSDWFILFDVYDIPHKKFWSVTRRNDFAKLNKLIVPPEIISGQTNLNDLTYLAENKISNFSQSPLEGLIVRIDDKMWNNNRAKIVRKSFVQSIDDHWSSKGIKWNKVKY